MIFLFFYRFMMIYWSYLSPKKNIWSKGICPQSTDNWAISPLEVIFESQMGAIDVIFGWEKRCKSNRETGWYLDDFKAKQSNYSNSNGIMIAKSIESHQKVSKSLHQNEASSQRCTVLFGTDHDFYTNFGDRIHVAQHAPKPKKDAIVFVCHQSWDGTLW